VIRRRLLLVGATTLVLARQARAGETITLLVGAKAGSPTDVLARAFFPFLARQLPVAGIAVSNVYGGAGLAAFQALAQAEPTGSTLGWVATPSLPARMVDRGADDLLRRITLLGAVEKEPIAIVSPAATPLSSVQDIVTRAADDAEAVPLARRRQAARRIWPHCGSRCWPAPGSTSSPSPRLPRPGRLP
jgi:tripartite-type tricarboxylate transporter receptor subunit TctC